MSSARGILIWAVSCRTSSGSGMIGVDQVCKSSEYLSLPLFASPGMHTRMVEGTHDQCKEQPIHLDPDRKMTFSGKITTDNAAKGLLILKLSSTF